MDPLSITVSVLTLVQLCIKSSASLHEAIEGFNSSKKDVQLLKADIGDLNIVLQALAKNIQDTTENFEALRLILQQCTQMCERFHRAVLEALGGTEKRFQGVMAWVRLQYYGNDIENFRKLIGSYKATITIALADSNLRTSKVTRNLLQEYMEMTTIAASNLEEQIEEISAKLDLAQNRQQQPSSDFSNKQSNSASATAKQTLDQKASLEQCLSVCQQLLAHIAQIKPSISEDRGDALKQESVCDSAATVLAPQITSNALELCSQNLNATARHLRDLQVGSLSRSKADEARVIQQLDSAQKCLDIVKLAQQHRVNVFENIDTAEDSHQFIISTIGDLIKANGLTIGARAVNIMGQMNDESLQKMADSYSSATISKASVPESGVTFENRHGFGKTLEPGRKKER